MIRTLFAAIALTLACTGEAAAQGWTFDGVPIPERDGWCTTNTEQNDGSGGTIAAFEVRACGQENPYMSLGVAARELEQLDIADLTAKALESSAGDSGRAVTAAIFTARDPDCVEITHTITPFVADGINAFDLYATYDCPALSDGAVTMRTLTGYAQRANGDVWVVAFDHPTSEVTDADKLMLRNTFAAITAH